MTQPKKKTAFVPCKSFKHDGATLTVGVAEVTVNRKPNPSEVYLCVKYFGDEGTPEAGRPQVKSFAGINPIC